MDVGGARTSSVLGGDGGSGDEVGPTMEKSLVVTGFVFQRGLALCCTQRIDVSPQYGNNYVEQQFPGPPFPIAVSLVRTPLIFSDSLLLD